MLALCHFLLGSHLFSRSQQLLAWDLPQPCVPQQLPYTVTLQSRWGVVRCTHRHCFPVSSPLYSLCFRPIVRIILYYNSIVRYPLDIGYYPKPIFQTVLLGSVSCCIHLQSPYLSHDRATHNYSSWINKRVLIVIPQKANTRTTVETGTKTVTSFLPSSAQVLLINRPWKLECHVLVRLLIRLSERPWKLKLQALVKCIMLKMFTKEASMSANIGSCILYEVPQQLIKPLDLNMVLSPNHFYICGTNSV